jgi:hypothetical protein
MGLLSDIFQWPPPHLELCPWAPSAANGVMPHRDDSAQNGMVEALSWTGMSRDHQISSRFITAHE